MMWTEVTCLAFIVTKAYTAEFIFTAFSFFLIDLALNYYSENSPGDYDVPCSPNFNRIFLVVTISLRKTICRSNSTSNSLVI